MGKSDDLTKEEIINKTKMRNTGASGMFGRPENASGSTTNPFSNPTPDFFGNPKGASTTGFFGNGPPANPVRPSFFGGTEQAQTDVEVTRGNGGFVFSVTKKEPKKESTGGLFGPTAQIRANKEENRFTQAPQASTGGLFGSTAQMTVKKESNPFLSSITPLLAHNLLPKKEDSSSIDQPISTFNMPKDGTGFNIPLTNPLNALEPKAKERVVKVEDQDKGDIPLDLISNLGPLLAFLQGLNLKNREENHLSESSLINQIETNDLSEENEEQLQYLVNKADKKPEEEVEIEGPKEEVKTEEPIEDVETEEQKEEKLKQSKIDQIAKEANEEAKKEREVLEAQKAEEAKLEKINLVHLIKHFRNLVLQFFKYNSVLYQNDKVKQSTNFVLTGIEEELKGMEKHWTDVPSLMNSNINSVLKMLGLIVNFNPPLYDQGKWDLATDIGFDLDFSEEVEQNRALLDFQKEIKIMKIQAPIIQEEVDTKPQNKVFNSIVLRFITQNSEVTIKVRADIGNLTLDKLTKKAEKRFKELARSTDNFPENIQFKYRFYQDNFQHGYCEALDPSMTMEELEKKKIFSVFCIQERSYWHGELILKLRIKYEVTEQSMWVKTKRGEVFLPLCKDELKKTSTLLGYLYSLGESNGKHICKRFDESKSNLIFKPENVIVGDQTLYSKQSELLHDLSFLENVPKDCLVNVAFTYIKDAMSQNVPIKDTSKDKQEDEIVEVLPEREKYSHVMDLNTKPRNHSKQHAAFSLKFKEQYSGEKTICCQFRLEKEDSQPFKIPGKIEVELNDEIHTLYLTTSVEISPEKDGVITTCYDYEELINSSEDEFKFRKDILDTLIQKNLENDIYFPVVQSPIHEDDQTKIILNKYSQSDMMERTLMTSNIKRIEFSGLFMIACYEQTEVKAKRQEVEIEDGERVGDSKD